MGRHGGTGERVTQRGVGVKGVEDTGEGGSEGRQKRGGDRGEGLMLCRVTVDKPWSDPHTTANHRDRKSSV